MNFKQARKELVRVGSVKAEGEALLASYALIAHNAHGGDPEKYYNYLVSPAGKGQGHRIIAYREVAMDVLIGVNLQQ